MVMARFLAHALVAGLYTSAIATMVFINPPPLATPNNFANAATYKEGSTQTIRWSPGDTGKGVSLVLYQQNMTTGEWYGDMEYLTQNALSATSYTWLVGSRKNLTESNLFYLCIFQEGKGPSDSNSEYFYIAQKATEVQATTLSILFRTPSASSSTSSASTSPTAPVSSNVSSGQSATLSSSRANTSPTSTSASSNGSLESPAAATSSFPTAAKIGMGVGIPIALILGLGAGFLLFRRRKKKDIGIVLPPYVTDDSPVSEHRYYSNGSYYGSNLNEAPPKSPVEMGHRGGDLMPAHQGGRGAPDAATIRYEM